MDPSHQLLQRVLDALPDMVFAKDAEGRYTVVNRACADLFGRSPDEMIGRTDAELLPTSAAEEQAIRERQCVQSRRPSGDESWVRRPDGTRTQLWRVLAPLVNANDEIVGVAGCGRDLHLLAQQHPNDPGPLAILNAIPLGIYWKDVGGRIAGCNTAFMRLAGAASIDDVVGRTDEQLAWRALEHVDLDGEVLGDSRARRQVVRREVDRYGRERYCETTVVPLRGDDGTVIGVLGIRDDVTSRMDTVRRMERARAQAEAASRSKASFLADVGHGMRSPLTALLAFAERTLDDRNSPEARRDDLERVCTYGREAMTIVNDLLDLSRLEAGRVEIHARTTCVRALLDELDGAFRDRIEKELGLTFEVSVDEAVPDRVRIDPIRVRKVLTNLVEHTMRQSIGGAIRVTASTNDGGATPQLVFAIRGAGVDLSEEQIRQLLEPFDADHVEDESEVWGLGLAVAWRLACLMDGGVDVGLDDRSNETCLTLRMPLRPAERLVGDPASHRATAPGTSSATAPEDTETASPDTAPEPLGPLRVLYVEDVLDNQRIMTWHLRKAGHGVDVADNGQVGIEMIAAASDDGKPYDLVLMDIQMPVMDGYTATRQLRADGVETPIIAVTAHAMSHDRAMCLAAGCDDYATKPIDRAGLLALIERTLRRRAAPDEAPRSRVSRTPAPPTEDRRRADEDRRAA